jgi:molybdopterin-containing oxidoreductase family iron-sulfur binding subunit
LAQKEFQNEIPVEDFLDDAENNSGTSRRDFLKLLGFSTAAVTLAACEAPVIKTIPYVVKPHDIIPGFLIIMHLLILMVSTLQVF